MCQRRRDGIARCALILDPALVRALFVVSILLPGPQVLIYLALWIIIPREPAATVTPVA